MSTTAMSPWAERQTLWMRFPCRARMTVVFLTLACTVDSTERLATPGADRFGRMFIERWISGDANRLRPLVKQSTSDSRFESVVAEMKRMLPDEPPHSIRLVGAELILEKSRPAVRQLTYNVVFGRDSVRVELWVEASGNGYVVETFRVAPPPS